MRSAAGQVDPTGAQLDEEQGIDGLQEERCHHKEIADQDLVLVMGHQLAPNR